ncbi:NlpC/P60 family protein [Mesorhizobium sp. BR1-1-16]|uniref:NlpC/P60 family protein n=1 Tax=Mesorhizobium sp. BR1-1-16 TaxID=2876653 RepID=UPI001CCAA3DC|nr:NlpC/P60 family protein [Mesorhizobium sp. BR1-1-16]MBZ9935006.1 NlpC/P60 family protein [Mesorhizobium sp. BR1-1-16]
MTSVTRAALVSAALGWLGTPYRHQASLKGIGADCLGLVRGVWREVYGEEPEAMPAYTPDWAEARGAETLCDAAARHMTPLDPGSALPGDLLLFRWREGLPAKHAAILAEPGRFIHAHDGAAVAMASLTPWWARRLAFVFSFPGVTH